MGAEMQNFGVLGAGAFGTAMAVIARRAGRTVTIWAHETDVVDAINTRHENETFLPNIPLDPAIRATNDLDDVCENDAVIIAVPTVFMRTVMHDVAAHWREGVPALICSKGVEQGTCKLMAEVVGDCLPPGTTIASMGGPTFAKEIALDQPASATLACPDLAMAERLSKALASPNFRTFISSDIIGTQLGGATKNVIAIACGIVTGMGLGDSVRAALISRGLSEINDLGLVLGAKSHTLMGLSGLGDLSLTCNAMQSRNFTVGHRLGQGETLEQIMGGGRKTVAEGVPNAETVTELARRNQVDMPICIAVEAILTVEAELDAIIHGLLSRPIINE